jgi:hypothetical protein
MPKQRNHGRVKETAGAKGRTAANARRRAGQTHDCPTPKDWAWLDAISGSLDADMIEAALDQPPQQDRPNLETLFPSGEK